MLYSLQTALISAGMFLGRKRILGALHDIYPNLRPPEVDPTNLAHNQIKMIDTYMAYEMDHVSNAHKIIVRNEDAMKRIQDLLLSFGYPNYTSHTEWAYVCELFRSLHDDKRAKQSESYKQTRKAHKQGQSVKTPVVATQSAGADDFYGNYYQYCYMEYFKAVEEERLELEDETCSVSIVSDEAPHTTSLQYLHDTSDAVITAPQDQDKPRLDINDNSAVIESLAQEAIIVTPYHCHTSTCNCNGIKFFIQAGVPFYPRSRYQPRLCSGCDKNYSGKYNSYHTLDAFLHAGNSIRSPDATNVIGREIGLRLDFEVYTGRITTRDVFEDHTWLVLTNNAKVRRDVPHQRRMVYLVQLLFEKEMSIKDIVIDVSYFSAAIRPAYMNYLNSTSRPFHFRPYDTYN